MRKAQIKVKERKYKDTSVIPLADKQGPDGMKVVK
jgi:hypothetical protein